MEEVKELKRRNEIEDKYKWKIEKVYESIEAWEEDFLKLKKESTLFKQYSTKLSDCEKLLEFLKLDEKLSRLAEKLFVYAHLRVDEDTTNTVHQGIRDKIDTFLAEFKGYKAFFTPELLSLSDEKIQKILNCEKLKEYRFILQKIINKKPHILSKEEEELLAKLSDSLEAPGNAYAMLSNADMTFPVIKDEDLKDVELTEGNYGRLIKSKDRRVREEAFKALFNTYGKYKNTISTTLTSSMKNFILNSKVRKYKSALESSLKPNDISLEVYHNLIKTINDNLSSLHRYVRIKKKLLNLDEIHMYDLYVPVVDLPQENIPFEEAVEIVKKGLKPLGEEYLDIFKEGIEEGWIDVYENKGKRGGAYSWGSYDTMPYVLLNYDNTINDVSTLAHEMGHSIHSYYSRKTQPFFYAEYELFCAEVASTTNEALLINYLIKNEKDEKRKLYLINQHLEEIRTTVFRQVMFAEFELLTHESLQNGTPLTSDDLSKLWHELNVKYYGEHMAVDSEIDMEWARIPHFYTDFYVYQYATGYAAASSFASSILEKGEEAILKYKDFLKSGGSDYPINLLKKAGVDMTTEKPLLDTIKIFNSLLDMLDN